MKTLNEIIEWLQTPDKIPVVLAEIPGVITPGSLTMFLSSVPFASYSTDATPNKIYNPCIIGGINFSESLSLSGTISINYGDIEIDNIDGSKDFWLTDYIWANKDIQLLIGDVSWNRDDFRPIFNGTILDISTRSNNTLNILISDKMQKLNNPITEELLPSIDTNSEILVPLTFGEVFNVTPIKSSTVINTLEYKVHNGQIEDIIEVRDNGVPVTITKNLSVGTFTLSQNPYGQITCSVQGDKNASYYNDIANIIKRIVKSYGPAANRLVDADIDLTNFSNFSIAYTQPVGVYIPNRDNILTICNKLASSIGAQLSFSSTGLLRLIVLTLPATGTGIVTYDVGPNDFEYNSLSITDISSVRSATKLSYCKNYTNQRGSIAAGVPTNNKALFEEDFLFESVNDSSVQSAYKLTSEPQAEETSLLTSSDAIAEATRRNNLWKVPRYIVSFKAYGHLLPVELGDAINLTDSRYGLEVTKTGLVVKVSRDWLNNRVTIGILI